MLYDSMETDLRGRVIMATYNKWKLFNRVVKRGEKCMKKINGMPYFHITQTIHLT